jgi:hypothetical protein
MRDPHGFVVVRQSDLITRHEGSPRYPAHGVEYAQVVHTGTPSRSHEPFSSGLIVERCSESTLPHPVNA